ncbi:MAG: MarR family transcriptional regulator [Gordonia sp. (in: high G+C Gram-positive bacteria)]
MATPPRARKVQMRQDLESFQESIAWVVRLGQLHSFVKGDAGGGAALDRTSFLILCYLDSQGPVSLGDIARVLDVHPSSITKQTATLVDAGFIVREKDPYQHRAVIAALTDAGRAKLSEVRRARSDAFADVFAEWDEADLRAFAELLARYRSTLVANFEAGINPGRGQYATRSAGE